MSLQSKINAWVKAGLIKPAQGTAILAYEETAPKKSWVAFGVVGIGITAVITGIVSVIAANWDDIPNYVKLGLYFITQIGLGLAVIRYEPQNGLRREGLLTAFALLFLGGIGLLSQIYNLHGEGWEALLLWCAITAGCAMLARSRMLPHLWCFFLAWAIWIWCFSHYNYAKYDFGDRILVPIFVSFLFLGFGAINAGPWGKNRFLRPAFRFWTLGALLFIGTPAANYYWAGMGGYQPTHLTENHFFMLILSIFAAVCLWAFNPTLPKRFKTIASVALIGLAIALAAAQSMAHAQLKVIGCVIFMVLWSCAATCAALMGWKRLFDLATLVIAIRFVIVYFEVFGTLAQTGVGLIMSGVILLGATWAWKQYRVQLMKRIGGKV